MTNQTNRTATDLLKVAENIRKATQTETEKTIVAQITPTEKDLYKERNDIVNFYNSDIVTECQEFINANCDLVDNIAIRATWSTLNFLVSQGATIEQATESTDQSREERTPYGYNMALELLQELPSDLAILRTNNTDSAYQNAIDLIQEIRAVLHPLVALPIIIENDTIIYTKQLKNGTVKEYTLFKLACNTIRQYIRGKGQKQYKKLAYFIGYTESGEPVYSTKKPKDTLEDITDEQKKNIFSKWGLSARDEEILLYYVKGFNVSQISLELNIPFETVKKALYRAKKHIKQVTEN